MKKSYLILLTAGLLMASCTTTKTIKFSQKENEVQTTESLSRFLSQTKNPKVVLRVNDTSQNVTDKENNNYLYNAIENQLMASGFIVRDRQLFNQIIGNTENNVNYDNLNKKSDTDLIIELTKLDPSVVYETNKFYDSKGREKTGDYANKKFGATVEFKVVMIKNNDFAGLYRFNYTPCIDGCMISQSVKELNKNLKLKKKLEVKGYEGVEKNQLEEFMKVATQQLVAEMRK